MNARLQHLALVNVVLAVLARVARGAGARVPAPLVPASALVLARVRLTLVNVNVAGRRPGEALRTLALVGVGQVDADQAGWAVHADAVVYVVLAVETFKPCRRKQRRENKQRSVTFDELNAKEKKKKRT